MKLLLSLTLSIIFLFPDNTQAQSIELDKKLGYENAKMVEAQMGIYPDLVKTAYFKSIGDRLLAKLEDPLFDYQFHIVPDAAPNAFALPGGYIYITTGLLPLIENKLY